MFGFSVYLTIVYGQKYWKLRQIWWLLCCPTSLLKLLDNGSTCSMYLYLRYWHSIFSIFRVWTSLSICSPSKPKYHKYDSFFLLSIQTVTMDVIQKIFIVVFFGHHKSILDLLQVHCAKKKININQMKSLTDPHNGGMNTITAACYK